MAGKAYTMREMRAIVDYLNERKAYGEIKGRKMWMEFANSDRTMRTWQSLKETFLKRILPDIQNPYYKLTMDQVRSFQQGHDVVEKEKMNRLEFQQRSGDLNAEDQNGLSSAINETEVPTTSHEREEQTSIIIEPPTIDDELERVTGEDIKAAKIPSRCRSSAETLVLEYENAEDVRRVLESPSNETESKTKSLKDMLTFEYTAPLTPDVQSLLDDFATDSETSDTEPRLKIAEDLPKTNVGSEAIVDNALEHIKVNENKPNENNLINNEADSTIEIHDSDSAEINDKDVETTVMKDASNKDQIQAKSNKTSNDDFEKLNTNDNNEYNIINETNTHKRSNENSQLGDVVINTESILKDSTTFVTAESNDKASEKSTGTDKNTTNCNNITPNTGSSTQNTSSDTLLPNNQEALDDSKKETQIAKHDKTGEITDEIKSKESRLGKRSSSRDSRESKKLKLPDAKSKEINNDVTSDLIEIVESPPPTIVDENPLQKNKPIIEIIADTPINESTNNTEELFNKLNTKETSENVKESNANAENDVTKLTINHEEKKAVEDKNPCLVSVNLYEEQFNNTKYSDSDSNDATKQKQNTDKSQAVTNNPKEIDDIPQKAKEIKEADVVTNKASVIADKKTPDTSLDSSADCEPKKQGTVNNTKDKRDVTLQRERALANVFGFAHGIPASNSRKRHLSHRRRSHHQRRRQSQNVDSNSSEWTSESDNESYVSPPRGRKNRQTKRYLKPKSSRILQDPEEGMLYVIFGKNIYPLVKDGKHIKKFLTYRPDSGSEEEESFWRQKYVEEKKRVEEIRILLKQSQKNNTASMNESTQPSTSRNRTSQNHSPQKIAQNKNPPEIEMRAEAKDEKMVLKIAGKDGLEYSLEGGWNQISNAMPQVVKMLQCETTTDNRKVNPTNRNDKPKADVQMEVKEVSSGISTPVLQPLDAEAHEKVEKLENEIFTEIMNLDAQETEKTGKQNEKDSSNVTKRRPARSKKSPSTSETKIPTKRTRSSKTNSTDSKSEEPKTKRISKTKPNTENNKEDKEKPVKITEDTNAEKEEVTPQLAKKVAEKQKVVDKRAPVRKSNLRLSKPNETSETGSLSENATGTRTSGRLLRTPKKSDTDSPARDKQRSTKTRETPTLRFDDDNSRYMFPPTKTSKKTIGKNKSLPDINIVPPHEGAEYTIDSAQGYQDSDGSPMKICLQKRKKRVSYSARNKYKNRRISRRSYSPALLKAISNDSNNSSYFVPLRRSMSSLNSEVYRSESYQLLMPKQKPSSKKLERIDENNPAIHDSDIRHFNSVSKDFNKSSDNSGCIFEGCSSSMSLPLSPELSVVEKMSISREMIKDVSHPTINEAQQNINTLPMDYSEYMISNLDISVPLMDQRCNLRKSIDETAHNANKSQSVQLKDCTVNLTLSDTLDRRLRELLLESNKKPAHAIQTPMEVDLTTLPPIKTRARKQKENITEDVDVSNVTTKKAKPKTRSSTPQKKKTASKAKAPQNPVIEEEHVESCSAGRKSCPPVMTFIPIDENANNSCDVALNPVKNAKKKKDIIKVKIQKPRDNSRSKKNLRSKSDGNGSIASSYTDSGINDTETISLVLKDSSVDLIHNHSETCLMANECIGSDSVEFVQNSPISIISLSSSIQSEGSSFYRILQNPLVLSEDTSNNLDNVAPEARTSGEVFESPKSTYHSLTSNNSLITEDLSNSPPTQPTKWYLFDEDVTNTEPENMTSFGSNLKQIFPITCAVPNLSTISEMSKENEDSRKTSDP